MVREIVLGDLWGIEESVWVQLWSGVLGAVVSAVVAAFVAVTVLNRSNQHQVELAAKAVEEQQRLADKQLEEQRRLANLQLTEQRRETMRARRNGVLADLLGTAGGFVSASDDGVDAVSKQLRLFEVHAYRWKLEERDRGANFEMLRWGHLFSRLAMALAQETTAPPSLRNKWVAFFTEVETSFQVSCIAAGLEGGGQSSLVPEYMSEHRHKFARRWESLMEELDHEIQRMADGASDNS